MMTKFHPDAFQFEWPALEMQGYPIIWQKLGNGLQKLEIPDPVRVTILESKLEIEGGA